MRHAMVTGGGGGVGRAVALRLARDGWRVAILGRSLGALEATSAVAPPDRIVCHACDVTDQGAVARVRNRVGAEFVTVDAVVNPAGTNVVHRSLDQLSVADFHTLVDVNLVGAFHVAHAFLPLMRGRDRATIVNIASDAGLVANVKAGAGYVASKFGLAGLTHALNLELRGQGIRVTAVFPGDIDTALLEKRPVPPRPEARAIMLQTDDVAECVMLAITLPHRAVIESLVVRPRY